MAEPPENLVDDGRRKWPIALAWLLLAAALVVGFEHNFWEMWQRWFPAWRHADWSLYDRLVEGESYYTHGPLVPLVFLVMVLLLIRHTSIRVKPSPVAGGVLLGLSLLLHLTACLARVNFASGFAFIGALAGLVLIGRLTQSMDLWCVKALLASDQAPGHYGAAQYVYQAAFGLAAAVVGATFPALTQAVSRRDKPVCRELIQQSFRFVFVTMLGALALVACGAEEVVTLIFSASFAAAATPATILMAVAFMSGVHAIGTSALIAAGKPGLCLAALAPLVPLNIGLNLVLVPQYGLTGAALATASTALLGSAIIVVLVWREFHVGLPLLPLARISLVALAVYFLGRSITATGPVIVARLLGLLAAYLLLLFLTGELTRRDLQPLMFWRA